jgi:hypothetical protein
MRRVRRDQVEPLVQNSRECRASCFRRLRLRDIRALLAERQVSPPMARVVLINTLVAMIKHLGRKDTMEEAAEDLVRTLQRAISKSH